MSDQTDRLNELIDQVLNAGRTVITSGDAELDALLGIAIDLVDLPREEFRVDLGTQLIRSTAMTTSEKTSTDLEMPDIYPRLAYDDERAALDYLVRVFQLSEIREARMDLGDTMLAWLRVGNGVVMIGHATEIHQIYSPRSLGNTTVQMMVYVHDIDAHHAHALAEGAHITMPLEDAVYGERRYEATDLEGHRWHFAEPFADIKARGGTVPDDPQGGKPQPSTDSHLP